MSVGQDGGSQEAGMMAEEGDVVGAEDCRRERVGRKCDLVREVRSLSLIRLVKKANNLLQTIKLDSD